MQPPRENKSTHSQDLRVSRNACVGLTSLTVSMLTLAGALLVQRVRIEDRVVTTGGPRAILFAVGSACLGMLLGLWLHHLLKSLPVSRRVWVSVFGLLVSMASTGLAVAWL